MSHQHWVSIINPNSNSNFCRHSCLQLPDKLHTPTSHSQFIFHIPAQPRRPASLGSPGHQQLVRPHKLRSPISVGLGHMDSTLASPTLAMLGPSDSHKIALAIWPSRPTKFRAPTESGRVSELGFRSYPKATLSVVEKRSQSLSFLFLHDEENVRSLQSTGRKLYQVVPMKYILEELSIETFWSQLSCLLCKIWSLGL